MRWHWQISAGELFELFRPAALFLSALLSVWVLTSARRWGFKLVSAFAWTAGTFFLPLIVLPLYLVARSTKKRSLRALAGPDGLETTSPIRLRHSLPLIYGVALLLFIAGYIYRDYTSLDAHLARAEQRKVMNQHNRAIREYVAALQIEDNPHTHKLLGIELAEETRWEDALREFRAADTRREPDDSLPYRMGLVLTRLNRTAEAAVEYRRFLDSSLCRVEPPDVRCALALQQLAGR